MDYSLPYGRRVCKVSPGMTLKDHMTGFEESIFYVKLIDNVTSPRRLNHFQMYYYAIKDLF